MKKVLGIATCCTILAGCGSVTQPVAQISLVDSESFATPEQTSLKQTQVLTGNVTIGGVAYTVSDSFYSASGKNCRFLNSATNRRLFCNSEGGIWQEVDDVLVQSQKAK